MKFSIAGTIPTGQYANIQPTFEIEADSNDEALQEGLRLMQAAYQAVGKELPLEATPIPQKPLGELLTCWASGTRVYFDPVTHTYSSPDGARGWLSGSAFAKRYTPEFAAGVVAQRMAAKIDPAEGVIAEDFISMWAKKAEVSSSFGTSLHAALELFGSFRSISNLSKGTDESVEVANPYLAGAVRAFFDGRDREDAYYEAFVADPDLKHCGLIDRLKLVSGHPGSGDAVVRVQDFKTNGDIHKSETIKPPFKGVVPRSLLGMYWLQLSFYARILESHSVTVDGLDIFHWNGSAWDSYEHDVVDLSEVI